MTNLPVRVSSSWLDLREPADGVARSTDLVAQLLEHDPQRRRWVIHDLGAGSGSMGRWLAPLLPGRQHWVLHDRDTDLLQLALRDPPSAAADGADVTVATCPSDLVSLDEAHLADADLITASALLDMFTRAELTALVDLCVAAGCPALLALSVVGVIAFEPPDPLDARLGAAFNAHQRRPTTHGTLLGPDAAAIAAQQFTDRGAHVAIDSSPWQLGSTHVELCAEWLSGWVRAACEQDPSLDARADEYVQMRRDQLAAGQLRVTINHVDLLVRPR